jgi:hypothetical protein
MDLEKAKALVESKAVQKYINGIDEDAEIALGEFKATLAEMDEYPNSYLSEYKKDAAALDKAWGDFNSEWNKIALKRAKDGKAALAAYKKYVLTLCVLEEQNVRFGAYITADAANQVGWLLTVVVATLQRAKAAAKALIDELKELMQLLKKAQKEVKEAELQRAIGIALTVVGIMLPELGAIATITIGVASITVSVVLDASLGPGKPSIPGGVVQGVSTGLGMPKILSSSGGKLAGAMGGIYGFQSDSDEVAEAEKIVVAIQEKARKAEASLNNMIAFLGDDVEKIRKAQAAADAALREATAAAKRYTSAEKSRLALLKELGELK